MTKNHMMLLLAGMLVLTATIAGCGSKVTKDNFDKIKVGMTEKEVTDILGEGKEKAGVGISVPGVNASMKVMVWTDGDKTITVNFMNGKVGLPPVASGL